VRRHGDLGRAPIFRHGVACCKGEVVIAISCKGGRRGRQRQRAEPCQRSRVRGVGVPELVRSRRHDSKW
jgi:hypothetical protein